MFYVLDLCFVCCALALFARVRALLLAERALRSLRSMV
jgi:hypothetical protein